MNEGNDEPKNAVIPHDPADGSAELTTAQLGHMLIQKTPLQPSEDRGLYRKLCETLLDEISPESAIDSIDADDLAHNLVVENRIRQAVSGIFEQRKHSQISKMSLKIKKELRGELLSGPDLKTLLKLAKLENHYGQTRRTIAKEFRARARKRPSCPLTPAQPSVVTVRQSPPLTPDHEQVDER